MLCFEATSYSFYIENGPIIACKKDKQIIFISNIKIRFQNLEEMFPRIIPLPKNTHCNGPGMDGQSSQSFKSHDQNVGGII